MYIIQTVDIKPQDQIYLFACKKCLKCISLSLYSILAATQVKTGHRLQERPRRWFTEKPSSVAAAQYGFSLKVSVLASPSHFSHSCAHIDSDCQKPDSWPIVAPVRVTQSLGGKQLPPATPLITLQGLPGPGGASVCQKALQPQPSTTSLSLPYLIHGGTEAASSSFRGCSFANPSSKSKNMRLDSPTWISWKTKKHHHMPTWRQQREFFSKYFETTKMLQFLLITLSGSWILQRTNSKASRSPNFSFWADRAFRGCLTQIRQDNGWISNAELCSESRGAGARLKI